LGRHVLRVRRVLVVLEGMRVDVALPVFAEYPAALVLAGTKATLATLDAALSPPSTPPPPARAVYLLDPEGRALMRYDGATDYLGIVGDLKHLLTASGGR
jgi:hypothetical protein